jgi:MscS family membrane protein
MMGMVQMVTDSISPDTIIFLLKFLSLWAVPFAGMYIFAHFILNKFYTPSLTYMLRRELRVCLFAAACLSIPFYILSIIGVPDLHLHLHLYGSLYYSLYPVSVIILGITLALLSRDSIAQIGKTIRGKSRVYNFGILASAMLIPGGLFLFFLFFAIRIWGFDVQNLLLASGVVGLVLGLALQDTLSNVFAGFALRADEAIADSDLIVVSDGKIQRVDAIGFRSTRLYNVGEHSLVYMPNSQLAASTITNITRPTYDLRVALQVGVDYTTDDAKSTDLETIERILIETAELHPNVLVATEKKRNLLKELVRRIERNDKKLMKEYGEKGVDIFKRDLGDYKEQLRRLKAQIDLDTAIEKLRHQLEPVEPIIGKSLFARTVALKKEQRSEFEEIVEEIATQCQEIQRLALAYDSIPDPWSDPGDYDHRKMREQLIADGKHDSKLARHKYKRANEVIEEIWRRIGQKEEITALCRDFRNDLIQYQPRVQSDKNPEVSFVGFDASSIDLALNFYIDDITLNHYRRQEKVILDMAQRIKRRFDKAEINIPFPQTDIHIKEPVFEDKKRAKWMNLRFRR